jgi:cytochrome c oxidase cbb3-type subunit 3
MTPRALRIGRTLPSLAASALLLVACDRPPADVRDWTPADHDQPPEAEQAPQRGGQTKGSEPDLVEVAWQRSCASCHGRAGRGDGPQGPMNKAPDLTRADWQAQVSDAQIAETIRTGKNKMPAFDKLPAPIVEGLVKRIRSSRGAP